MSKHIREAIWDYLKSDTSEYALLLNGKWGSGKTYFWKNVIEKHLGSELEGENQIVYISLYGISSVREIETKILSEFLPRFLKKASENKTVQKLSHFSGRLLSGFTRNILGAGIKDLSNEISLDYL